MVQQVPTIYLYVININRHEFFMDVGCYTVRVRNNIKCVMNMHCSKKSLQFQGYVLEFKTV